MLNPLIAFDGVVSKVRRTRADYAILAESANGNYSFSEYLVDVRNVARSELASTEYQEFGKHVVHGKPCHVVLRERLGATFIDRGLYPVAEYFRQARPACVRLTA
jgi:hypothetical protein